MLPRWITGLVAVLALIGAITLWLFPAGAGSYTATHGPRTAFRDKQASRIVAFVLMAGATAQAGITSGQALQMRVPSPSEDSPAPLRLQSLLEFDCTLLC